MTVHFSLLEEHTTFQTADLQQLVQSSPEHHMVVKPGV